jgi:hypothetical protein
MRGYIMNNKFIISFSSIIAIVILFSVYEISVYMLEEKRLEALSNAISEASSKGVNPLAVRCAFVDQDDTICIVYASKNREI